GTQDSPLSHAAGHAFMRRMLRAMATFSIETRMDVIAMARDGIEEAKDVLRNLLLELRSRRMEVPLELEAYEMEILHGEMGHRHRSQGEKEAKRKSRDIIIIITVEGIRKVFRINPTGRSPRWRSGCDICAEALGVVGISMSAKNVERVWSKYGRNAAWLPP